MMMNAKVDVLAVMDRLVTLRAGFLPTKGAYDLCGKIEADPENPITAAFIERHREAAEARAAVAELVEAAKLLLFTEGEGGSGGDRLNDRERLRAALAKFGDA